MFMALITGFHLRKKGDVEREKGKFEQEEKKRKNEDRHFFDGKLCLRKYLLTSHFHFHAPHSRFFLFSLF